MALWVRLWPGWLGRCTLRFPWAQGHSCRNLDVTPANLPSIRAWRTERSVFQWCDHLAAIFVPSVGLEDVISHVETLTKFTQKPLNDSNQAVSLLNSEVSVMRKAVLQNRMALDSFTASQGGTDAIIQAERCVYTPDKSSNVTYLMTHLKNQMAAWDDPFSNLGDLLGRWFGSGNPWLKSLLVTLITLLAVLLTILLQQK